MALIRLSDAINNLREELNLAQEQGKKSDLKLNISSIEIELEVVAESEGSAGTKVNWWVLGGELALKEKDARKHKLKLTLQALDSSGKAIRVSQEQLERPM
ncbi:hypothetical protein BST81_06480 [Leptolyngbya sp. 'hensonii']|uniref:trypco2 family protein n=1 Tax=Leptolyngbya sp. 'hensonii' TaxID=1922337 RepID=UPI00094F71B1|nr:trypco2 family protein [Leptolyngbya sp. 'hensonii']OLP19386.1 hypothetical protein BST81_06480 [Leptolyngbya sp. 'hensonii']